MTKPLGVKNYGSIPHIPGSRMGKGDHHCHAGQEKIALEKTRDKHDRVICTEKLDGSNVGVAKKDGVILPLTRAGYLASTSPYRQHHIFANWVYANQDRFNSLLNEGERVVGEWLLQAHSTRYRLWHEPFVAFDLFDANNQRMNIDDAYPQIRSNGFTYPFIVHDDYSPCSLNQALNEIAQNYHNAIDPIEGVVWRVERKGVVDFVCKYVRHNKVDGIYLFGAEVWNELRPQDQWLLPELVGKS